MKKTCCFTGPTVMTDAQGEALRVSVKEQVEQMLSRGVTRFACCCETDADLIIVTIIFMMRLLNPKIELILYLSDKNRGDDLPEDIKEIYEIIKSLAAEIHYAAEEYSLESMAESLFSMIDDSDICVLCPGDDLMETILRYATQEGLEIIQVNIDK